VRYHCINMEEINFTLWHPFTMCVVGPSGSGKTHFVCELIRNRRTALSEPVAKVIYIYSDYQEIFMKMQAEDPNIIFVNRLEELEKIACNPCLIIVDDFLTELRGEKLQLVKRWFLKHSHHRGASIILLLQNAFAQGLREVSINSHYLVIFDQPRDRSTITTLARQICPGEGQFLQDCFKRAVVGKSFGYLFLNFHPKDKLCRFWIRSSLNPIPECEIYSN